MLDFLRVVVVVFYKNIYKRGVCSNVPKIMNWKEPEGKTCVGGLRFMMKLMTLRVPPPAAQSSHTILEHWNIGTNEAKSLIHKVKSCSKRFSILEQT